LIHISDLSWSKKIKHPSEFTKVGDDIEVVVLDTDKENRRLSLGHKQLEENPWDVFETVFTEGSVHQGTITSMNDKGAVVGLPYGVEGFAPTKHMSKEDGTQAKVDDTLDFKVIEFSKENKKIIVSHARTHEVEKQANEEKESKADEAKKAAKKVKDNLEKSTLGDLDVLANLKSDMEESEKKAAKKKS
jgi:small subunit ribosomal protein S1